MKKNNYPCFLNGLSLILSVKDMKYLKRTLNTLGVSVVVIVNSSCKADGG